MSDVPFTYGRIAEPADFTDREEELAQLKRNFNARVNTILISPRRWGKTSLVKRAGVEAAQENKKMRVCHIDIFNLQNENEFYLALVNGVLKATSSGWEELVQDAKTFLSGLIPSITFSPDRQTDISFGLGWEQIKRNPGEILDLAEKLAQRKKLQLVICIDEFQAVSTFTNPEGFQKKLRSHWQGHAHVTYCLYGSKRNMLMDVFSNPSMPFYKFGELMFLRKIETEHWVPFIQKRFKETGKHIMEEDARLIAELADNHPYYVQQLAQQVWFRTAKKSKTNHVLSARENIVDQLSLLFTNMIDGFSNMQLNLLKAILAGENQLTSQLTLRQYNMGTSANVVRLKKGFINAEIIDETNGSISFMDPMLRYWLETRYFKLK